MRKTVLINLSLCFILGVMGCSASRDKDKSLATFDGGSVSVADFETAIKGLSERVRKIALRQKKEFLESYITEKLLLQEAEKKGTQHLADVQDLLKAARQKILVAKLIEQEVESKVQLSPRQVQDYYRNHQEEFMTPYRVRASHILLRSRDEATAVLSRIQAGDDFAQLAKEVSLDPTGPNGGDLGFFEKGQLISEIEEAGFSLDEGEISDVIQTSFGFHLIKVTDIAKPQEKDFVLVENEIREKLVVDEKSRLFSKLTDRLKRKANISINEEPLAEFSLDDIEGAADS